MTSPDCEAFRHSALDALESSGGHPAGCDACAAWLARQRQVAGLLGMLDRFSAPEGLDRAVAQAVAANQRRAQAFATLEPRRAPNVLRRLVQEDVEAGASAVVARSLAGLERQTAPPELALLVAERIESDRRQRSQGVAPGARPFRDGRPSPLVLVGRGTTPLRIGLVAAAALLIFSLPPLMRSFKGQAEGLRSLPEPRVQLAMVTDIDRMDPLARALAAGVSGGVVDISRGSQAAPRALEGQR
ncbi:hypothetical protein [Engelhardtia mirabilis]|uniref:Uncharacterized protein n=1 Tax=Engelhardtia mirabilis TaxID=2528011 RepID=A0A518BDD0_9BACT|nr:hypothetical protein Pla133_00610 [Planctomycetes bacterium Pla133]QDU99324.1 hypothetical protein Pla86_00610 [Planctomycetes bacterium Pla86]